MMPNVLNTDLTGKVAVVTGAGGVLCSAFAKVLARAGAKVALLDLNYEAADKFAREIVEEGGVAKAYSCNVLDKAVCYAVADQVLSDFGPCDVLLNGAGGNNPRATTDKEYFELGDIEGDTKSFFDLDKAGVEFVFNLNFIGTLIPTQAHQDPRLFRRQGRHHQLYPVAGRPLLQGGHPGQRHRARILLHAAERHPPLEPRRQPHRPHRQDPGRHAHGSLRSARGIERRIAVPPQQRRRRLHHRRKTRGARI